MYPSSDTNNSLLTYPSSDKKWHVPLMTIKCLFSNPVQFSFFGAIRIHLEQHDFWFPEIKLPSPDWWCVSAMSCSWMYHRNIAVGFGDVIIFLPDILFICIHSWCEFPFHYDFKIWDQELDESLWNFVTQINVVAHGLVFIYLYPYLNVHFLFTVLQKLCLHRWEDWQTYKLLS